MAAVFRWSSCQADFYSSESESDGDDFEFGDEELEFDDVARVLVVEDEEPDKHKRWSEFEAIKLLRENKWNIDETVTEMLQEATHDSLNHLSSQGDEAKNRKVTNMKLKLRKLKTKLLKFNIVAQEKQGGEEFLLHHRIALLTILRMRSILKRKIVFLKTLSLRKILERECRF